MSHIRAVCFDLGGVLIRIHPSWEGATSAAGVESVTCGPLGGFAAFERYQEGAVADAEYFRALQEFLGVSTLQNAEQVHMAILREAYPGTEALARSLASRGILCGCASNTNAAHWREFHNEERFGFWRYLRVRIGSHIERSSKPAPELFGAFERAAGVEPGAIAYFDDSRANVEASSRLGWVAHQIDPAGDTVGQMQAMLKGLGL